MTGIIELDDHWIKNYPEGIYYVLHAPEDIRAQRWGSKIIVGWLGMRPLAGSIRLYVPFPSNMGGPYLPPKMCGKRFLLERRDLFTQRTQSLFTYAERNKFYYNIDQAVKERNDVQAMVASA
jgi:hypothetical protein